jgi:TrmH family RNA methyltransferase
MITIRKLASLPKVTALRKAARLLHGFEVDLQSGKIPNLIYYKDLISFIANSPLLTTKERTKIENIRSKSIKNQDINPIRCNQLRHLLLTHLNEEPADWDLLPSNVNRSENRKILPFGVYLDDIRSPFNVGSIFRSSESFGVSKILISHGTASPTHKRASRSSMGCIDIIPWKLADCQDLNNRNTFALELNGIPVNQFKFPNNGIVIIGSEELGVSPECLTMAEKSFGKVSIPLAGTKGSINVSVAFGILMYNWYNQIAGDILIS